MLRSTLTNCFTVTSNQAELIVIDNGSNQESRQCLTSLVRELDQKTLRVEMRDWSNLGRARNLGLSLSQGDFVVFLDSDDLLDRRGLAESYQSIRQNKDVDVRLGGWCKFFGEADLDSVNVVPGKQITFAPTRGKLPSFFLGWDFRFNLPIHSAIFRKKSLKIPFREDLLTREDFDFWLNFFGTGVKVEISKTIVAYYRRHGDQMTQNPEGLRRAQKINRDTARSLGIKKPYLIARACLDVFIHLASIVNKRGTAISCRFTKKGLSRMITFRT